MIYLNVFNNQSEYLNIKDNLKFPNISVCKTNFKQVYYQPLISIENAIITCDQVTYNGNTQIPTNIIVTYNGTTLIENVDYVIMNNNGGVEIGNYEFTIKGIGHYTRKKIGMFTILPGNSKNNLSASVSMTGWTYGTTASNPSVSGNSGNGSVTYSYKVSTADDSTYTTTKPSNAGTYTVRAVIAETTNYYGTTVTHTFTIAKANLSASVYISNWAYGSTASNPSVSGNRENGSVTYSYKVITADDSTYTTTKPSNAGTYTVKAVIAGTANYYGTSVTDTFTISKVTPTVIAPTPKVLTYTGSAQELVNAGSTNYGTLKYAISEGIVLPYDSQIEYLEGDGRQYINTTIVPNSSTGLYMEYIPYQNNYYGYNDMFLIGTRNDTGNTRWILGKSGADGQSSLYYGYGSYAYLTDTRPPVSSFITATLNYLNSKTATVSINNVSSGSKGLSNTLSFVPSNPIRIFGSSGVNASYSKGAMRLYACKISQGTNVILDLIPVRKNSVGYLYDKISGTLYGNAGTSSFILGKDVSNTVSGIAPSNENYTTSIPSKTNIGDYSVYYKVDGDDNINNVSPNMVHCSIVAAE